MESTISGGYSATANTNSELPFNSGISSVSKVSQTGDAVGVGLNLNSTPNTVSVLGGCSGTNTNINMWGLPIFIKAREVGETIEFLYTQTSMLTLTIYPSPPPAERVFKIVYSCKDGKWNKSEPIYGKIIPASDEYYEFDETEN